MTKYTKLNSLNESKIIKNLKMKDYNFYFINYTKDLVIVKKGTNLSSGYIYEVFGNYEKIKTKRELMEVIDLILEDAVRYELVVNIALPTELPYTTGYIQNRDFKMITLDDNQDVEYIQFNNYGA